MLYKVLYSNGYHYVVQNTQRNDIDLNVFETGYSKTPPGIKRGPFIRDVYVLHYLANGNGFFNGEPVGKEQGFLSCPNQLNELLSDKDDPWEHYWIMFNGLKAGHYLQKAGLLIKSHVFRYDWSDKAIPLLYDSLHHDSYDRYGSLYMHKLFFTLLSYHESDYKIKQQNEAKYKDIKEKYVQKAVSFINLNYQNRITIDDVIAHVNISSKYLCHLFNKYIGYSPQAYLIQTRLSHADELLRQNDLTIQEVANSVGYDNASNFTQIYKKHNKTTPSRFKNTVK